MPSCLIHDNDYIFVFIGKAHLFQIQIHHFGIYPRQEQREVLTILWLDCAIYVEILVSLLDFYLQWLPR